MLDFPILKLMTQMMTSGSASLMILLKSNRMIQMMTMIRLSLMKTSFITIITHREASLTILLVPRSRPMTLLISPLTLIMLF